MMNPFFIKPSKIFSLMLIFLTINLAVHSSEEELGSFGGRISKLNAKAKLLRVRVKFKNAKFFNKNDRMTFSSSGQLNEKKCVGYVKGKSNYYLLLKVPHYKKCIKEVHLTVGAYLHFQSEDLVNNIKVAREIFGILLKKRLALKSKIDKQKKNISVYIEKVETVNERYQLLKDKLDLEWQQEVHNIKTDQENHTKQYKQLEIRLGEVDHKIEQYRIEDTNFQKDRWALDSKLYYKK